MRKTLTILYATCSLDVSGVTKLNLEILKGMTEDFSIHVCVTKRDDFLSLTWDDLFAYEFKKPVKLWRIPTSERYRFFLEYLVQHKVDIIYVTHSLWVYENAARLKRDLPYLKIVDSLHVLEPYCFRGGYPDISANRFVHPYIDKSIVISQDLLVYLKRHYPVEPRKFVVIRNGINTERFRPEPTLHGRFKEELGIPSQSKLIGFIGRFAEQKRPLLFVDIAQDLAVGHPDIHFYMIGSGALEKKVKKRIARYGLHDRILLFRQRDDIQFLLNSTDLLMVTSSYEGAPLTILEALAVGVPVIATDVGAVREYVDDRCIVIPRGNRAEKRGLFAAAVLRLMSENKDFQPLPDAYQLKNVTDSYRTVFQEVVRSVL